MREKQKGSFNTRAFVALTAAVAGLGLPVSGYFNHLLQMEPMTYERHAWMSAHNVLGVVFVVFAVWHICLNRKAMLVHMKVLRSRVPFVRSEAALAVGVVALCLAFFVGHAFMLR